MSEKQAVSVSPRLPKKLMSPKLEVPPVVETAPLGALRALEPPPDVLGAYGVPEHWMNVATSLKRVGRNREISVNVGNVGYARKMTPCEGFVVELRDGSAHFIPAALLLAAR